MFHIKYRLRYEGKNADDHILPAHEGAQSLEGMTWSFALLGNYVATGQIRKRGNLDSRVRFFISPPRRGSFATDIVATITDPNNIWLTTIVGTYAVATATDSINALFKYSFKAVCGIVSKEDEKDLKRLERLPSGDLEALVDGIEPSISRAHSVIGVGAKSLSIDKGRTPLLQLNNNTKDYVRTSIVDSDTVEREVSVGALNVNSGNGRVYLEDIGKTVPFSIIKEPIPGTYQALSRSLDRNARGLPSDVNIDCQEVTSVNGLIKKLIIHAAWQGD